MSAPPGPPRPRPRRTVLTAGGGAVRAEIDPAAGGRLASLQVGGVERLVTAPTDADPLDSLQWGCFPMAPWAGRLRHATVPWRGRQVALAPTLGAHGLHGVAWQLPHTVRQRDSGVAELSCLLPRPRWPWGGRLRQRIELARDGLVWTLTVEAGSTMPVVLGWHPWFARPAEGDLSVTVRGQRVLETDEELLPTGEIRSVRGEEDLRSGPLLGERRLDHAVVDPRAPAEVCWPDLALRLEWDDAITTVVVHTPPEGVCVEPQTAWPDALTLGAQGWEGTGLAVRRRGETLTSTMRWRWEPLTPAA